ncbi:MAG: lipopolysaccharide assembly LapA domain-containing protein [Draconibacterium sp.]
MSAVVVFLIILAVLLVIFTLQNSIDITIHVFFWEISSAPLVLVLLTCILLGYLLAVFYFSPRLWKFKRENKKMQRANDELQRSIHPNYSGNGDKTEVSDPEGIELNDDSDSHFFFKD